MADAAKHRLPEAERRKVILAAAREAGAGRGGGGARPRRPEPDRRKVVLAAATEVVAERGVEAASISEIAERAGITRPIVYDHFRSKQDIVVALIEHHHATLMSALGQVAAGPRRPQRERRGRVAAA